MLSKSISTFIPNFTQIRSLILVWRNTYSVFEYHYTKRRHRHKLSPLLLQWRRSSAVPAAVGASAEARVVPDVRSVCVPAATRLREHEHWTLPFLAFEVHTLFFKKIIGTLWSRGLLQGVRGCHNPSRWPSVGWWASHTCEKIIGKSQGSLT